jgi:hypothetical protein
MNVALIEHAKDDIDNDDRGGDKVRLAGQRRLECLRVALEIADQGGWSPELRFGILDRCRGLTQGDTGCERGQGAPLTDQLPIM